MILNRYFFREVYVTFLAVLAILLLIFFSRHFVRYLAEAAAGDLPASLLWKLLTVLTLSALDTVLPFALFFAVLFAFGRLYKDSEMTAAAAGGYGLGRVLRGMTLPIALMSALVGTTSLLVSPWAAEQGYKLRAEAEAVADVTGLAAGGFREVAGGDWIFYVEEISADRRTMRNVFIQRERNGQLDIFVAPEGRQQLDEASGDRFLILERGFRYEGRPDSRAFQISEYQQAAVQIERREVSAKRKAKALPTAELLRSKNPRNIAELQWRLSMPLSAAILMVLGVLFAYTTPRQGRFAKLLGAILIYIIYSNLLGVAQTWVANRVVAPAIGMWWVHLLMLGFIGVLVIKRYGMAWSLHVATGRARG